MKCSFCQAENEAGASTCSGCGQSFEATWGASDAGETLPSGTLFDSRYEILDRLGRGGMGIVYRARDRMLDETVAIKVLNSAFARDETMARRFKSEIKLARKVRHRNVCAIHDYGEDRGLLYITMELVEGIDLKRVLKTEGALPEDEAYEMALQVAEGLQAVHDAGIIHRDLKASNIIRDRAGVARLMDFGVAKRHGTSESSLSSAVTATGQIIGTPDYMSPEQAQGKKIDFRSDIYALGVVIYEIFTGRVPFHGDTPISTILKHIHDSPPVDGPGSKRIPPALKPVIRKALAKSPLERYATARDVAAAIARARERSDPERTLAEGESAPTAKAPVPPKHAVQAKPPPPRRGVRSWHAIVLVVLVGLTVWAYFGLAPSPPVASSIPAATTPTTARAPSSVASTIASTTTARATTTRALSPSPTTAATSAAPPPPTTSTSIPETVSTTSTSTAPEPEPVGTGALQIAVVPWAEIRVDGEVIGTTPLDRISLPSGAHSVEVRHPSYEPIVRDVTIEAGKTEKIVVNLAREGTRKPP